MLTTTLERRTLLYCGADVMVVDHLHDLTGTVLVVAAEITDGPDVRGMIIGYSETLDSENPMCHRTRSLFKFRCCLIATI